jgi:ADP-ribose pyrophosphatase
MKAALPGKPLILVVEIREPTIELERCTSSSRAYDGRILNLRVDQVTLVNGKTTKREIIEHRGAAAIVPVTQDGKVILVRQYRYAITTNLLEIPAGTMEPGETPNQCASRELEEETGYKCKVIEEIMKFFPVPGYSTEKIHVYLARGLTKSKMHTEEDEKIELEILPFHRALEKIRSGEIQDAKSICALYRCAELV